MGYGLEVIDEHDQVVFESGMSYNQSVFKDEWYAPRDWDTHTVKEVLASLRKAIRKMEDEGLEARSYVNPYDNSEKSNFLSILVNLRLELVSASLKPDYVCRET